MDRRKDNDEHASVDEEDIALWKGATKDVKPLAGQTYIEPAEKGRTAKSAPAPRETIIMRQDDERRRNKKPLGNDLDGRTDERLRKGLLKIDGTIDLHGLTQEKAHPLLERFILGSYQQGRRCVLIITGKGRISQPGVLRQKVPQWLSEPPLGGIVLKSSPAQPKHGGSGALYVYLRRQR